MNRRTLIAALLGLVLAAPADARRRRSSGSSSSSSSPRRARGGRAVRTPLASDASFRSCAEARAAGAAPLRAGDPGYSTRLDRDRDGIACE